MPLPRPREDFDFEDSSADEVNVGEGLRLSGGRGGEKLLCRLDARLPLAALLSMSPDKDLFGDPGDPLCPPKKGSLFFLCSLNGIDDIVLCLLEILDDSVLCSRDEDVLGDMLRDFFDDMRGSGDRLPWRESLAPKLL